MGETKDAHIVEIPVDQEQARSQALTTTTMSATIQQHPMTEISRSPGHLLLLKLWQREEDLFARRMSLKERRLDSIRAEIFQICCFFVLYYGFFSTILFMSSAVDNKENHHMQQMRCTKWWVPSILSMVTSLAMAGLVQMKMYKYWKVGGGLQRAKGENRALTRSIQELRMKGASFDLSKESQPQMNSKRMKSSSVEVKWMLPISWCSQYLVTLCLVLFAGLAFPAPKLFLCTL